MPVGRRGIAAEWLVPGLVAAIQTARLIAVARLPDAELVQHIPDDAFYYLVMGRNFVVTHRWTFDGVEPASGFHLLWGYLLAAMYWLAPGIKLHGAVAVEGAVQTICMSAAAWLGCRTARRIFGDGVNAGVALVMLSAISLLVGVGMMETSLVLLASAAALDLLSRTESNADWSAAALLGFSGTLARSDFFLLPLCLLAMQVVLWRRRTSSVAMVGVAAAVCTGAGVGVLVVALHTHWISGQWVQSSVQAKLHWTNMFGVSAVPVENLLFQFFDVSTNAGNGTEWLLVRPKIHLAVLWLARLLIVATAVGLVQVCRRKSERAIAVGGFVLALAAYAWAYRYNRTGLLAWYIGQFEMPLALLVGGGASYYASRARAATWAVCVGVCVFGVMTSLEPSYPWQTLSYEAGLYVRQHPDLKPVGAWNAGALGYFGDGGVVNLDGLVNDSILPYAKAGTMMQYVQARGLRSIFDSSAIVVPWLAVPGGDGDAAVRACLIEQPLDGSAWTDPTAGHLTLYRVLPDCPISTKR